MEQSVRLTSLLFDHGPQLTSLKALQIQTLLRTQPDAQTTLYGCRLSRQCSEALVQQHAPEQLAHLHTNAVKAARLPDGTTLECPGAVKMLQHIRQSQRFSQTAQQAAQFRAASAKMDQALLALARSQQDARHRGQPHQAPAGARPPQSTDGTYASRQPQPGVTTHVNTPLLPGGGGGGAGGPVQSAWSSGHQSGVSKVMCNPQAQASRWAPPAKRPLDVHDPPPSDTHMTDQDRGGGWKAGGGRQTAQQHSNTQQGQQGQQPAVSGFQTARQQYNKDLLKQGKGTGALLQSSAQAPPRTCGLTRPNKRGGGQAGNAAGSRNGFVPPYLSKAIDSVCGDEGRQGKQPGGEEGPWSDKLMSLLAGPDGCLPPEIEQLDPKIVEQVCSEILDSSGQVQWEDVAGLEVAKKLLQEIIVWPMTNPQLFTGARAPPRGLLLFGPPGTGKTMIGKAVASNISATFFSISASSLTSKWIGEGEKMVRALFTVARSLQPSVIFIDEIDSVLSMRKSDGEHEASRRLKTEMLIQMDGCSTTGDKRVLLIGATNRPEELDEAARRRMPKQLYIPLPCALARRQMVLRNLGPASGVRSSLSEVDLDKLVTRTDGYSGSDMRCLIQEACQGPVRDAAKEHGSDIQFLSATDLRPVLLKDFQVAARAQKASVTSSEVQRYIEYDQRHGAKYAEESQERVEQEEEW